MPPSSDPAAPLVRRALREHQPYQPGTTVEEVRRRFGLEHVVKLSQNENPLGTSPRALEAVRRIGDLSVYLEDDYTALRAKIGARHGLHAENVVLGHGSNELVGLVYTTFVDPGDEVVMGVPTFSLFAKFARIHDAIAVEVPLRDGVHDLDAMAAAVTPRTKLVFVCDPNNPTGTCVGPAAMRRFAAALPPHVLLAIDQAYGEYMGPDGVDGVEILRELRPATLVLHTSSKILGLASLRFGYGLSAPEIISWMLRVRLPFNVARPAIEAVDAALDDREFIERSIANNEAGKRYLYGEFRRLGLFAHPTGANFIAVQVPVEADVAYRALMARGVVVRSGDGLRLPRFLRVTVGTPDENRAFIAALEPLLEEWRRAGSAEAATHDARAGAPEGAGVGG